MINLKKFKSVGIVGYGVYLPRFKIGISEIAKVWGKEGEKISQSLKVKEKTVADYDEDSVTMGVEASLIALKRAGISPKKIGALFVGSESHPYTVKPTGTIIGGALGVGREYFCADLEFACKAATAGIQMIAAFLTTGLIDYGLVIGTDKAQSQPGDALEYTAGAGAAAFILGRKQSEFLAQLKYTSSFSSDTPDFWRREGEKYPSHAGRFTGEPGYFYHVVEGTKLFLKKTKTKPTDYDYAVFHMPNGKFPRKAAQRLGFKKEQIELGLIVETVGNPYSASSLLGLGNVFDQVQAGKRILLTSYGSGAGSDTLSFVAKRGLLRKREKEEKLDDLIKQTKGIDYSAYLRKMEVL
jgi:hydroxymethylglutaryl-CoA synthase